MAFLSHGDVFVLTFLLQNEESISEDKRATDMQFAEIDMHGLPHKGLKKIEGEQESEPPVYPNQAYLAKVIVERIAHIIEQNEHSENKLLPLLKQANGTTELEDVSKVYTNFKFMIYTAISNMLEYQTAMRLADPQSDVLSPEIYRKSWKTRGQEALSKVRKYHPEVINSTHRDLVKEVENNPKTLFLIVADEAHVAITKNEEEDDKNSTRPGLKAGKGEESDVTEAVKDRETANNTLVNFWKDDRHPNVVVLQV